jgi:hypothetical protein
MGTCGSHYGGLAGSKLLRPGRYRVAITALDTAGARSKTAYLTFTVLA